MCNKKTIWLIIILIILAPLVIGCNHNHCLFTMPPVTADTVITSPDELGFQFDKSTGTITRYNGKANEVIIPEFFDIDGEIVQVKIIGKDVFMGKDELNSVKIPKSITEIGNRAFLLCGKLSKVEFEENSNLIIIKSEAFSCCSKLTEIIIPDSVTEIEDEVFNCCSAIRTITIGENVKLGKYLFNPGNDLFKYTYYGDIRAAGTYKYINKKWVRQ